MYLIVATTLSVKVHFCIRIHRKILSLCLRNIHAMMFVELMFSLRFDDIIYQKFFSLLLIV